MDLTIPTKPSRRHLVAFRVTEEERETVERLASTHGASLSTAAYALFQAALAEAAKPPKPKPPAEKPAPRTITDEDVSAIAGQYSVTVADVQKVREELRLYCQSTGKRYADPRATLQNWVRRKLDEGKLLRHDPHKESRPVPIVRIGDKTYTAEEADAYLSGNSQA